MNGLLDQLVFDWNGSEPVVLPFPGSVTFDDETLRDGLQSPSARHPAVEEKLAMLELAAAVGVTSADVGLPGAGAEAAGAAEALCRGIAAAGLPIAPNCAARAAADDITAVLDISQRLGRPVEIALFLASSPIRCHVEGWSLDELAERAQRWVAFAVRNGAPVTFVAEDATRSHPADLRRIFAAAVSAGATRICIADTAGQATPVGAFRVAKFVRQALAELGAAGVGLDWHGHNDRGLAVANALAAAWGGADRLHATALGVGERVGNPPMELLLVNARLLGWAKPDLSRLMEYAEHAGRMVGVAIPPGAPVVGRDAFRTTTGVHASAIIKAGLTGDEELVDLVYSAVPARWVGRKQEIEVGPMSGSSNVRSWLASHGRAEDRAVLNKILAAAKRSDHTLSDEELQEISLAPPDANSS
ncbi:MAG: 2-isopropylmalate synthase [Thermoanaerobaculaceae bacterium]